MIRWGDLVQTQYGARVWHRIPHDPIWTQATVKLILSFRRRGEVACSNTHEWLDYYGGSCDTCGAAV